ncbi:MAG: TldD/PmbA family protein, partial [Candidatus Thorarchaeota archaeon]
AIDAAVQSGAKRVAGALKSERELVYMRSSLGPEGGYEQTRYDLNIRAFQKELDYSGQGLSCGTMPSQDEKLMIEAGRMAGSLSKESVGAVQGKPGTYDLVMSPTVAANVMASLPMSANPFMVLIGLSPLGDRLGQKLAPEFVTIDDNGRHPRGIGSRPFDFEGTPTQTTRIFDKGVFKSFIHNTSTAKMFDSVSTGNSSLVSLGQGSSMVLPDNTNVVFENGDHSLEELLEGSRPTIYVTCNWYTRWQNHLTGEFSTIPRDAMFLVEHGKKTPIKNIRLSDNILRMFANIVALGDDIRQVLWWEVPGPVFVPSIKVADCRITAATK